MLVYSPKMQFFDNAGLVVNGGKLFIYQPSTTTKMNTYPTAADATAGTNANPNPIILNSAGRPANAGVEIDLYTTTAMKLVLAPSTDTDPPANAYWTENNITTLGQLLTSISTTSTTSLTVSNRDNYVKCDASGGAFSVNLPSAASSGDGFQLFIKKIDNNNNTITITPNGGDLIDLTTTYSLSALHGWVQLYCDGTQWFTSGVVNISGQTLYDTNGNPEITFVTTTSAVNYLTVTNAATGSAPSIKSNGSDTNVDFNIDGKTASSTVTIGKVAKVKISNAQYTMPNTAGTNGQFISTNGTDWSYSSIPVKITTINIQRSNSGTGTYTPTAGTTQVRIRAVGGGGGGGGVTSGAGSLGVGGGGGAGGYAEKLYSVASVTGQTYVIGGGGAAGTAGAVGGNGTTTTLTTTGTTLTANGGTGGGTNNTQSAFAFITGGAGGSSSNGDLLINGQTGFSGFCCNANGATGGVAGTGGSGPFGQGGVGGAVGASSSSTAGGAAVGYGAGGGGGCTVSANNALGGAGTSGYIEFIEYISS